MLPLARMAVDGRRALVTLVSGGRREERQGGYTAAAGNITHQPELGVKSRRDNRLCLPGRRHSCEGGGLFG